MHVHEQHTENGVLNLQESYTPNIAMVIILAVPQNNDLYTYMYIYSCMYMYQLMHLKIACKPTTCMYIIIISNTLTPSVNSVACTYNIAQSHL